MLSSYKKISGNIHRVVISNDDNPHSDVTWFNINNPGKKEIQYLRKHFEFTLSHLQASSVNASSQRPVISKNSKYIFIILHFPSFQNGLIVPEEIEFFIGENYLVTLHKNSKSINDFFSLCKKDAASTLTAKFESVSVLLYELLEKLMLDTYNLIDQNSIEIKTVESLIFDQDPKLAASHILALRRNIINARKIMQNHKNIIKKILEHDGVLIDFKEARSYYLELLDLSKRVWETLDNQREMIEVLNSANESLLNYHISNIMKTLTIFSVIVFPLTLFAAVFGMNTVDSMPFVTDPYGFWYIIVIMIMASLFMLLFFEKKKWFK